MNLPSRRKKRRNLPRVKSPRNADKKRALKKSDSKKELGFFSYFHYNRNIRRERLPC